MNYNDIYTKEYFTHSDGINCWERKILRFGDAFAAVCYAHGIYWEEILDHFDRIDILGKVESSDYTLQDQLNFIQQTKRRTPSKILEIGAGRGEVTCFLSYLGYEVICIEPCIEAESIIRSTSMQYFGKQMPYTLLNGSVHEVASREELRDIDTVIAVECLEHILEEHFNIIYQKVLRNLSKTQGIFIVTNWLDLHPIYPGDQASELEHCRAVDNNLYDSFTADFEKCLYRKESHICLQNPKKKITNGKN